MHPLETHHPEYLNHIMMRFGHHLSVHQRQKVTSQFNGVIQSSSQGSRIHKKLNYATAHHHQNIPGVFPTKPVVHVSKSSLETARIDDKFKHLAITGNESHSIQANKISTNT